MDIHAGIWIDHTKAVIVMYVGKEPSVSCIESNIPHHFRSYKKQQSLLLYNDQDLSPENRVYDQFRKRIHKYYKRVINKILYADQVFIFGPDEARLELKKEMSKSKKRFAKIVGVERADSMTEQQISVNVKQFFNNIVEVKLKREVYE